MTATIKAIPTEYDGRRYRSRLEARWAAFFDALHWPFEYEPFDLPGWAPDFRMSSHGAAYWLAEIKPHTVFDRRTAAKMARAAERGGVSGVAMFQSLSAPMLRDEAVQIGWATVAEPAGGIDWYPVFIGWIMAQTPTIVGLPFMVRTEAEGCSSWCELGTRASFSFDALPEVRAYPEHTLEVWARATNEVQWRGRSA